MKTQWNRPSITRIVCPALALAIIISSQSGGQVVINQPQGKIVLKQCTLNGTLTVRTPASVKP